jgi:hypothetical protein
VPNCSKWQQKQTYDSIRCNEVNRMYVINFSGDIDGRPDLC